jgi:hypothetical protein
MLLFDSVNIGMELMPLVPLKKAISSDDRISIFCVSGTTHPGRSTAKVNNNA